MRLLFSIGAVLVAGVLAGGDVAGIAAPGPKFEPPKLELSRQTAASRRRRRAVGRCRADPRGRRLLFHGHGRARDPARGLCAGDPVQGVPAGAEGRAQRQDRGDLFRMGRLERPEDHHPLAPDRRTRDRRCGRRRDPEDADPARLAHLDLRCDQICDAAVRRGSLSRHCVASSIFPATGPTTMARRSPWRAIARWRRASSSTACRSW